MKNTHSFFVLSLIAVMALFNACTDEPTIPTTVTDIDGNVYHTVTIGTQVWMVENLKTTKYRNGDPIPNVTDNLNWSNLTTGAYCNYNNNSNNSTTYGRLYNWYAVNDNRNIAPTGWHIPSDAEWDILKTFLGDPNTAGGKLKETGTSHWLSPNTGATNEYNFTGLPGEWRSNVDGSFSPLGGCNGYWWSGTEKDASSSWFRNVNYNAATIYIFYTHKASAASVRCVKD